MKGCELQENAEVSDNLVKHRRRASGAVVGTSQFEDPRSALANVLKSIVKEKTAAQATPESKKLPVSRSVMPRLTPRTRQTLELLLQGDSEKQIAQRLSLSRNTVHVYVKQLYRSFNVSSRGELLAHFVRHPS